jgi:hypothetical protein
MTGVRLLLSLTALSCCDRFEQGGGLLLYALVVAVTAAAKMSMVFAEI